MARNYSHRPTLARINLNNLAENFHSAREFIDAKIEYMAIVKADAYGHGAVECAKRLEREGVDWFGVALPEEGLELREKGLVKPILCLGSFWSGQETSLIENNLTPVIYQLNLAEKFNEAAQSKNLIAKIHVKIDTGMGRIGVRFDELDVFVEGLKKFSHLRVEGIMTHFAAADNLAERDFTTLQIERFNKAVLIFEKNGFTPKYRDLANSPAAIAHRKSRGNLVRLGGILYGLGEDVLPKGIEKPELRPVMSLHSRVAFLKNVPKGETLGYGRTFTTTKKSVIATVPIGYRDGFIRALSNKGRVIVNGIYAPIVGRISMDWTLVDVTEITEVKVNDEVVLIGNQIGSSISAEEIAQTAGTISYEITCGINRRVVREYVGSE